MLPLRCHGSPIVFPHCSGLCSRCSTVSGRHRIRSDGAFVLFLFTWQKALLVCSSPELWAVYVVIPASVLRTGVPLLVD